MSKIIHGFDPIYRWKTPALSSKPTMTYYGVPSSKPQTPGLGVPPKLLKNNHSLLVREVFPRLGSNTSSSSLLATLAKLLALTTTTIPVAWTTPLSKVSLSLEASYLFLFSWNVFHSLHDSFLVVVGAPSKAYTCTYFSGTCTWSSCFFYPWPIGLLVSMYRPCSLTPRLIPMGLSLALPS